MVEHFNLSEKEVQFYLPLIKEYLSRPSVDNVFHHFKHNAGVSYPHFHRILHQWGIIKSAGPNSGLSHMLYFMCHMAKEKLPLEVLYHHMPPSLKSSVSMATLHRVYQFIKGGITRRYGTALVVSRENNPNEILIGKDISSHNNSLGNFGSLSLPMTYSRFGEDPHISILRVFQQEVSTDLTLERKVPADLIPKYPVPLMNIAIADVNVSVYSLVIPKDINTRISSYKLEDLHFVSSVEIAGSTNPENYRAGVIDIVKYYQDPYQYNSSQLISELNFNLANISQ